MKRIISILVFISILAMPSFAYPDEQKINYWAGIYFSIGSYEYKARDAKDLGFEDGSGKTLAVKNSMMSSFKKHLQKGIPFLDVAEEFRAQQSKYFREKTAKSKSDNLWPIMEESRAYMEANLRAKHGIGAGVLACHIRIKRSEFPVLYEIKISYGIGERLEINRTLTSDIGYSTPEGIEAEIKRAIDDLMQEVASWNFSPW